MDITYADRVGACTAVVKIQKRTFGGALIDVRREIQEWIDANGYGASDIGGTFKVLGHPIVKKLSYNGRLWDAAGKEVVL